MQRLLSTSDPVPGEPSAAESLERLRHLHQVVELLTSRCGEDRYCQSFDASLVQSLD